MTLRWALSIIFVAAAFLVTVAGAGFVVFARRIRGASRRLDERRAAIVILASATIAAILLTVGLFALGP